MVDDLIESRIFMVEVMADFDVAVFALFAGFKPVKLNGGLL